MRGNPLFMQKAGFPRTPSGKNSSWLVLDHRISLVPWHRCIQVLSVSRFMLRYACLTSRSSFSTKKLDLSKRPGFGVGGLVGLTFSFPVGTRGTRKVLGPPHTSNRHISGSR